MIGNIISVIYLFFYIISGILISRLILPHEKTSVRVWLGCVIGLVMLLWLPAIFSFFLNFTLLSQLLALACTAIFGCTAYFVSSKKNIFLNRNSWLDDSQVIFLFLPLFLIGLVLFCNHTIIEKDGALFVGQSTYGDLAMHLGFITSIAKQETFPPMYSICPDTPLGYPFLSDSISSTFYKLGADLRFATLLPAIFAYALVILGVYFFYEEFLCKDKTKTRFATLLFFIGGGFGFAYFFDMLQENQHNFSRIFTAFYETPTNNVSVGIKWVNPIADMLVPQRATLFGWALLFPCLFLLLRLAFSKEKDKTVLLGIIAAALPLTHTHSFLALGTISTVYFIRCLCIKSERKELTVHYLLYACIVAVLALPQLLGFTFRQSGSFLKLHFNWANVTDNFFWFYIKNLGLLFLLLLPAIFDSTKRNRAIMLGPCVLWILAEFIQFQPNTYDNNKLLFVCFAFLCGMIADYLVGLYIRLKKAEKGHAVGTKILAVIVCSSLFLSGTLTLIREYLSEYQLFDPAEVEASEFILENTDPHATFLTHNNHNNTVAALTGRNIVCGSDSYLYFHGIQYEDRKKAIQLMFENPEQDFATLKNELHIDYVYISYQELYNYNCDVEYFADRYKKVFQNDEIRIYDVNQPA